MLNFRNNLKEILNNHSKIQNELGIKKSGINEIQDSLNSGELIVSVVGQVKMGKSTFLNALMSENVFPSKSV